MLRLLKIEHCHKDISQAPQPASAHPDPVSLPHFLHKISAGFPSPAADASEKSLDLNAYIVRNKAACFYFTVEGESMRGAGILPGDVLAVDKSVTPSSGSIVIAVLNNEFTVKRLYRKGNVVELRPENPDFSPIRINEEHELQIWGVVIGVIRKLRG